MAPNHSFSTATRTPSPSQDLAAEELAAVEKLQHAYAELRAELGKVIVGQEAVVEELLIALFCRGHALLVGVPGLAKTLLISTLARTLGVSFHRKQLAPGWSSTSVNSAADRSPTWTWTGAGSSAR